MFVDDLLMIANNVNELETMIQTLNTYLNTHFAILNISKTRVMARRNTPNLIKWLKKNKLTNECSLKYLGLTITTNNSWTIHTTNKTKQMMKIFRHLKKRGVHWCP